MAVLSSKSKGRKWIITGPRVPEYIERTGARLRELSHHIDRAMGVKSPGNGNGNNR